MLTNLMSPQNPFDDFPAPVICINIRSGMNPAFTLGAIKSNVFAKEYILWLGVLVRNATHRHVAIKERRSRFHIVNVAKIIQTKKTVIEITVFLVM